MTIIFRSGDFWIEQHEVVRSSIGAGGFANTTVTLDKSGHNVGYSIANDNALAVAVNVLTQVLLQRNGGGDSLSYGDYVETVIIHRANGDGAPAIFGAIAVLFMRT